MWPSWAAAVLLAPILLAAGCGGSSSKPAATGGIITTPQAAPSQAVKQAQAATAQRPRDPQAWATLVQAYLLAATQNGPGRYSAAQRQDLAGATAAFQRYVALTTHPDPNIAALGARAYAGLGDYSAAVRAWQFQTAAEPNQAKGWECLAVSAYAARDNRLGDLAMARAISLAQPRQRPLLRQAIPLAKSQPQIAQQC